MRGHVRPQLQQRRSEVAARATDPEVGVEDVALVAERKAEVQTRPWARDASVSLGTSSPIQSRPWFVKYSSLVTGWKSKPTLLRTPWAKYSKPDPSGLTREMLAWVAGGMQMLQGAPMLK